MDLELKQVLNCGTKVYEYSDTTDMLVSTTGNKLYCVKKTYHENLLNILLHREDGPAIEFSAYSDIDTIWYLNGFCVDFNEWASRVNLSASEKIKLRLTY